MDNLTFFQKFLVKDVAGSQFYVVHVVDKVRKVILSYIALCI